MHLSDSCCQVDVSKAQKQPNAWHFIYLNEGQNVLSHASNLLFAILTRAPTICDYLSSKWVSVPTFTILKSILPTFLVLNTYNFSKHQLLSKNIAPIGLEDNKTLLTSTKPKMYQHVSGICQHYALSSGRFPFNRQQQGDAVFKFSWTIFLNWFAFYFYFCVMFAV